MDWKPYIIVDPAILHGKAHFKGTRITVEVVLQNLAAGITQEEIIRSFPYLNTKAIRAVLSYGAEIARDLNGTLD